MFKTILCIALSLALLNAAVTTIIKYDASEIDTCLTAAGNAATLTACDEKCRADGQAAYEACALAAAQDTECDDWQAILEGAASTKCIRDSTALDATAYGKHTTCWAKCKTITAFATGGTNAAFTAYFDAEIACYARAAAATCTARTKVITIKTDALAACLKTQATAVAACDATCQTGGWTALNTYINAQTSGACATYLAAHKFQLADQCVYAADADYYALYKACTAAAAADASWTLGTAPFKAVITASNTCFDSGRALTTPSTCVFTEPVTPSGESDGEDDGESSSLLTFSAMLLLVLSALLF